MAPRRILLVDDQREVTRMLRASLEMLNRGYWIADVPSGEEALLELSRLRYDLLIADVRLPGLSGLELLGRVRFADSPARTILFSAYALPEVEARARELGAHAFFARPFKTEELLLAVQTGLGEEQVETPPELVEPAIELPSLSDRLSELRRDLGALAVLLISDQGQVVARAGDVPALNLDMIVPPLMTSFSAGMQVCRELGADLPTNIYFFDGDRFDIYTANVGLVFGLAMVFDGQQGARQMGPVMRYGRLAADDLLVTLSFLGQADLTRQPAPQGRPLLEARLAPAKLEPIPEFSEERLDEAAATLKEMDRDAFWETAIATLETGPLNPQALTFAQAVKRGLVKMSQ